MPPFIGFLVKLRWELLVRFGGDDRNDVTVHQVRAQPARIKGPVRCPAMVCFHTMRGGQQMSGHQAKVDEVAECVGQSQYLCRHAAARAAPFPAIACNCLPGNEWLGNESPFCALTRAVDFDAAAIRCLGGE